MIAPGKYDDECQRFRNELVAEGVLLVVANGKKGSGASCQSSMQCMEAMPAVLRLMADELERDVKEAKEIYETPHKDSERRDA